MPDPIFLTKRDAVVERLRSEIYAGLWPPGTPLPQLEIAARFAVSPTPVREAFRELEAEGLVESRSHKSLIVAQHDNVDWVAVYEIRMLVETQALHRVTAPMRSALANELTYVIDRGRASARKVDLVAFRQASGNFHRMIVDAANSKIYSELGQLLIGRSTTFGPLTAMRMRRILSDHAEIARTLKNGDGEAAVTLLATHFQTNIRHLRQTTLSP